MFREKIKIFDCTIRDGGLVNNHKFDHRFVREVRITKIYLLLNQIAVLY